MLTILTVSKCSPNSVIRANPDLRRCKSTLTIRRPDTIHSQGTHKHPNVQDWLDKHPDSTLHFAPDLVVMAEPGRALVPRTHRDGPPGGVFHLLDSRSTCSPKWPTAEWLKNPGTPTPEPVNLNEAPLSGIY